MVSPKKVVAVDSSTVPASSRSTIVDGGRDVEANKEKMAADLPFDVPHKGEGESALPEDKRIEALERLDRDWEHDVDNPRNWLSTRKWKMDGVVS